MWSVFLIKFVRATITTVVGRCRCIVCLITTGSTWIAWFVALNKRQKKKPTKQKSVITCIRVSLTDKLHMTKWAIVLRSICRTFSWIWLTPCEWQLSVSLVSSSQSKLTLDANIFSNLSYLQQMTRGWTKSRRKEKMRKKKYKLNQTKNND